jgi:DNA replication protein DnaC
MTEHIEERLCTKHGKYIAHISEIMGKTFETGCPECDKETDERNRTEETKQAQEELIKRYKAMNIEREFYDATFENYIAETQNEKHALAAMQKIVSERKGKIILLGRNGSGKTHLMSVAVKTLGGYLYSMYEISTMIRQSYTTMAKESELDIVNRLASCPMLAIDEIGRTKGSETEQNWLSYIVDKRHVRGLPFAMASNKMLKRLIPESERDRLIPFEAYVDSDILSRFQQDTEIITMFDSKDYRRN